MSIQELDEIFKKEVLKLERTINKHNESDSEYCDILDQFPLEELETILEIIFGKDSKVDLFCGTTDADSFDILADRLIDIINKEQSYKCLRHDIRVTGRDDFTIPVLVTIII